MAWKATGYRRRVGNATGGSFASTASTTETGKHRPPHVGRYASRALNNGGGPIDVRAGAACNARYLTAVVAIEAQVRELNRRLDFDDQWGDTGAH